MEPDNEKRDPYLEAIEAGDLVHLDTNGLPPTAKGSPPAKTPQPVKITVEYDDGSKTEAAGDDAAKIMQHWNDTETFCWVHGWRYSGPCLKLVQKPL